MQLTMFDEAEASSLPSSSGKTCPESSLPKTTPLAASLALLPGRIARLSRQGADGQTLVVCLDPGAQSRGGFSTPNISGWPNDASVCSLSQVLELDSIPPRYFLSAKACAGILCRAANREKTLPAALETALRAVSRPAR